MKNTLYWVTNDLRINDNAALSLAAKSERLLCVYIVDKSWFSARNFQSKHMDEKRWGFLQDCLEDLYQKLSGLNQQLFIVFGDTLSTLDALCDKYNISNLITTKNPGTYETAILTKLAEYKPDVDIVAIEQFTLFTQQSLPFNLSALPNSYSKFKKAVIDTPLLPLAPSIHTLPSQFESIDLPAMPLSTMSKPDWLPKKQKSQHGTITQFKGGERQAQQHLARYFSSERPNDYQNVRNNLAGWDNSTKLSPWLAHGCLSAKQVANALLEFEHLHGKNKSTECLMFELLWREYFQWVHFSVGSKMYQFKGIGIKRPLTTFYSERFYKWCTGSTPYPLVNACMKELATTGYLSNRGRQIVASCLVNELNIDWRYGAAWFEQNLIDYDTAVNWGNWQYIAGVGVDPRGGRHFNLKKQTQLYDPDKVYQSKWLRATETPLQALDSVDAADWPIAEPCRQE